MGRLSEQIIIHLHISSHVVHNSNMKGGNGRGWEDASIGVVGNSGGGNGQAQAAPPRRGVHDPRESGKQNLFRNV